MASEESKVSSDGTMRAVVPAEGVATFVTRPIPQPSATQVRLPTSHSFRRSCPWKHVWADVAGVIIQVLIKVHYSGINRLDLLQTGWVGWWVHCMHDPCSHTQTPVATRLLQRQVQGTRWLH